MRTFNEESMELNEKIQDDNGSELEKIVLEEINDNDKGVIYNTDNADETGSFEEDPIMKYYREIGQNSYLTREQELENFEMLENSRDKAIKAVIASPFSISEIIRLGIELRERKIKVKEVLGVNPFDEMYLMGVEKKREQIISVVDKVIDKEKQINSYLKLLKRCRREGRKFREIGNDIRKCHGEIMSLIKKLPFNLDQIEAIGQKTIEIANEVLESNKGRRRKRRSNLLSDEVLKRN